MWKVTHFSNGWVLENTITQKHDIVVHGTHLFAKWVAETLKQGGYAVIKLNIWFELGNTLCIEFDGVFEHNAPWYRPLMTRIRMELGAINPADISIMSRGVGGSHGAVWRMPLASKALRTPLDPEAAYYAVANAVDAFSGFPHNLNIKMEAL